MQDTYLLWQGIQLGVAIQLVVVGLVLVLDRKRANLILGGICMVVSTYLFKTIFASYLSNHVLLGFFLTGGLFFFYPSLLYMYVNALDQRQQAKRSIIHVSLAMGLFLVYALLRTVFSDIFNEHAYAINLVTLSVLTILILLYFYAGVQKFKKTLDQSLHSKAKKKYKIFYLSFTIFLLLEFFTAILLLVHQKVNFSFLNWLTKHVLEPFVYDIHVPLFILISIYLIVFALSQSQVFRSFFLNVNHHLNKDIVEGQESIAYRLKKELITKKMYVRQDLKLHDVAEVIGIADAVLSEYLKNIERKSFKTYINMLRIAEFKSVAQQGQSKNYSLLGIAQEVGFKSKATFYRVFKEIEGMTPSEFINTLKK